MKPSPKDCYSRPEETFLHSVGVEKASLVLLRVRQTISTFSNTIKEILTAKWGITDTVIKMFSTMV